MKDSERAQNLQSIIMPGKDLECVDVIDNLYKFFHIMANVICGVISHNKDHTTISAVFFMLASYEGLHWLGRHLVLWGYADSGKYTQNRCLALS